MHYSEQHIKKRKEKSLEIYLIVNFTKKYVINKF